ncbi:hypothetical protein [Zoogloea sp. 1C4]|uniref:hypothetical protein n=1 Tax=Zoogloea sp. 1C4 TaxID=2570190 RepID=UPI0012921860|nr:hypothetical protein [Zoogloea sp. 1C4]
MLIKLPRKSLIFSLCALSGFSSFHVAAMDSEARERLNRFKAEEKAIYAHMKRYGINRNNMAAMRRLEETTPPYSYPHVSIASEKVLNSGEHYRIEIDEFILTMKVPSEPAVPGNWIWPYTDTRTPDPAMERLIENEQGKLKVADLGWHMCRSIFPPGLFGGCETAGMVITYQVLTKENINNLSTPERMRKVFSEVQKRRIPTQEDIEVSAHKSLIDNRRGYRIVLQPDSITINGRIWIHQAMNEAYSQFYVYTTILRPDRMLVVSFGLPTYDYNANPNPSTHPAAIKRSYALLEELIASLRVAKINDDGAPDPFVIERVEPAPLPIREPMPVAQ